MGTEAVRMTDISKHFGSVAANSHVNLTLRHGEILSLLGENGSGKTTLMNMLAGIYFPDDGEIAVNGRKVVIRSPRDAFENRIGMIHQHFKLVDLLTAADNVILGEKMPPFVLRDEARRLRERAETPRVFVDPSDDAEPVKVLRDTDRLPRRILLALKIASLPLVKAAKRIRFNHLGRNRADEIQRLADRYGFEVNLKKKVYDMSVSEKQTVEIVKALYRGANILILDEPTAVLTPQETDKLFAVLRNMRDDGKSIIIITHKLNEVMAISDRVAVMRRGEHVATVNTADTDERELTGMMVGREVSLNIDRPVPSGCEDRLEVRDLNVVDREGVRVLKDVSFTARSGEILGIAGIAGSGQRELLEAIAGLQPVKSGDVDYHNPKDGHTVNLKYKSPTQIRDLGVRLSFVPEDRLGMGLVGSMDMVDNMMLRSYSKGHSVFVDRKGPKTLATDIIEKLGVDTPGTRTPVSRLSGGNVQKVLVGREISSAPTVLMAAYPVRGLDINSSYTIYALLNEQKQRGVAVIFVGEDLDVLVALCDRIMVLCDGAVSGIVDGRDTDKREVGLLMTGSRGKEADGGN